MLRSAWEEAAAAAALREVLTAEEADPLAMGAHWRRAEAVDLSMTAVLRANFFSLVSILFLTLLSSSRWKADDEEDSSVSLYIHSKGLSFKLEVVVHFSPCGRSGNPIRISFFSTAAILFKLPELGTQNCPSRNGDQETLEDGDLGLHIGI